MMDQHGKFLELHEEGAPLLMGNVWDVSGAKSLEASGYKALGTSSAAIAHSLGYKDGEGMTFEEMFFIVEKIARNVNVPLSADIEGGYGRRSEDIVENIKTLSRSGVVGVNLEDSLVDNGNRQLRPVEEFSEFIRMISGQLNAEHINVFLNIRTDPYLLKVADPLGETLARSKRYQESGANGIFVPCIQKETDIQKVVQACHVPVNVMCMPGLPGFDILKSIGVKRISIGNFMHEAMIACLKKTGSRIIKERSFQSLFN